MLNARKKAFAVEYVKEHSATRAAIKAGYSEKTAYSMAGRLLKNVGVQELIKELQGAAEARAGITVDKIVDRLNKIASNPHERASDRIKADELLGKYLGMFTEKINVEGNVSTSITKLEGILDQLKE